MRRWVFAVGALLGCGEGGAAADGPDPVGETSGADTEADPTGSSETGGTGTPGECASDLGPAPLRRLTHAEYNATVYDLLGDDRNLADAFTPDNTTHFDNQAGTLGVARMLVEQYLAAAEDIAGQAILDLPALVPCTPADDGTAACGAKFIDEFGLRAYRRPLDAEDREALVTLFDDSVDAYDFPTAIGLVVEAMLQSPNFLYRVESGLEDGGVERLDSYAVASRLSYLIWGSMPDDELFDLAGAGELGDPGVVEAQARRMLDEPRARDAVTRFHRQWLRLDRALSAAKDPNVYPTFTDATRNSAVEETERFVEHVVFDGEGDLRTLLTADYTFIDDELAGFYGAPSSGRVNLDPQKRAGFLTHASVLAGTAKLNQSSPVLRGIFVRGQLLCDEPPAPPPDVDSTAPDVDPGATTRERYAQHTQDPACAACHALLDPIGFGFEHYDGVGLWRDEDQGFPVDASGDVVDTDVEGPFDGARELAEKLADSTDVRTCFVQQWFRWAHGRAETEADSCTLDAIANRFEGEEVDVRELIVALTQTDAFMMRPAGGE